MDPRLLPPPQQSLIGKALGAVVGIAALILAFTFFTVFFAVALVIGIAVGGWLMWKTRALRRHMREHIDAQRAAESSSSAARGRIIEGEVIGQVVRDDERSRS